MNNNFQVGDQVFVIATNEDLFYHDFQGVVVGERNGFIQVRDQDDDVWEVNPLQVQPEEVYV
jgi:hypothetical protein